MMRIAYALSPLEIYWQRKYTIMLFMVIPFTLATSFLTADTLTRGCIFYFFITIMLIAADIFYTHQSQRNAERRILLYGILAGSVIGILSAFVFPPNVVFDALISHDRNRSGMLLQYDLTLLQKSQYLTIVAGVIYGILISQLYLMKKKKKISKILLFPLLMIIAMVGYGVANFLPKFNFSDSPHFLDKIPNFLFSLLIVSVPNTIALYILFLLSDSGKKSNKETAKTSSLETAESEITHLKK